jgi:hypothetical protein
MPAAWDEFTCAELAPALGQSRGAAEDQLGLARDLVVKLPGTRAAFWAGIVTAEKAEIIAAATGRTRQTATGTTAPTPPPPCTTTPPPPFTTTC